MTIKKLTADQLHQAYPVISQLRPHLTLEQYINTAKTMMSQGYQVACLYDGEEILAYAGFVEQINLYYGKHIYVHDLVVCENHRSKGYGKTLLSHIEDLANKNKMSCVWLISGVQRKDAHRFYEEKAEYAKTSYSYQKMLHPMTF
ncbi:MAG: GNAT family N-acetyltransferase [Defluviitaleaceae bacterium]|nr:GNAT family N-acetyltransferase [Defluviitaleaceae bacterium]